MKKYLAFSFVLASLFVSTNMVSAATIFSDDFGTGSTNSTVSGWTEGSDGAERRSFSGSGNDTASPNGGRFALMQGDDGWICKIINASGYNNLLLSYYWRGDDDANNPSDDGLVEYKSSGNCSDSNNTWTNLKNHDMQSDSSWTQQSAFSLPNTLNNSSFLLRFHTDTNSSSEDFRIDGVLLTGTTVDSTAPVITRLGSSPVTVEGGSTYIDAGATATDNIDGNITASIVTVNPVNTAVVGTYTVTYNVQDVAGNNATQVSRTVNVVDTTKPVITLLGSSDVTIQAGSAYSDAGSTVTDNVDTGLTVTVTGTVNTSTLGDYTLNFNVTDSHTNVADTVTRIVHVIDTTKPVITLTDGDMSIHTGDTFVEPGATAIDNLDGSVSVSITGGPVVTTVPATFTLHYNAVDSQGNNAVEKTRTVTIVDASVPVIHLVGSGSIDVPVFSTYTDQGATATDDVDGDLTSSIVTVSSVNTSILGTYTVTYNVSDSSLNAATQITRTVHVIDTIAPEITLNGDNPMHLKKGEAYVEPGATATDNYDIGPITVTMTGTVNTAVPATYTINYFATDSTEHTTSTSRSVIVRNLGTNSSLSALIPSAGTLNPEFDGDTTSYTVVLPFSTTTIPTVSATTTDEFASKVITQPASVTGTATVVVTSEDTSEDTGTSTTYTVVFSVAENPDHTVPVITLLGSNTVNINVGDTYTDQGATAQDDMDGNITESIVTASNVNTAIAGTYSVTYNVSDSAGNHAEQVSRTVNVNSPRRGLSGRLPQGSSNGGRVLGAEKFIFTLDLKLGSKGDEVTELQKFLNANGYTCGPVDGKFGPLTDACVRAFQKANPPLAVDGIVGPLTRAVLNK